MGHPTGDIGNVPRGTCGISHCAFTGFLCNLTKLGMAPQILPLRQGECPEGARGYDFGTIHTPPAYGHPLYLRGGVSIPIIESRSLRHYRFLSVHVPRGTCTIFHPLSAGRCLTIHVPRGTSASKTEKWWWSLSILLNAAGEVACRGFESGRSSSFKANEVKSKVCKGG